MNEEQNNTNNLNTQEYNNVSDEQVADTNQPTDNTFQNDNIINSNTQEYNNISNDQNINTNQQPINKNKHSKIGLIITIIIILIIGTIVTVLLINKPNKNNSGINNNSSNTNTDSKTNNKKTYSTCAFSNTQCTEQEIIDGQLVNIAVNDRTNYDFYVINDDGTNLTLIKDGSLGKLVAWTSDEDAKNIFSGETGRNYYGPYTVLNYLNELTKDWTKINIIQEYHFHNPDFDSNSDRTKPYQGLNIENGTINLISNDSQITTVPGKARARLLTVEEINNFKYEKIEWLQNKINEEFTSHSGDDNEYSYAYMWLLDATDNERTGDTYSYYKLSNINVESTLMVYPVITVSKIK